MYVSLIFLSFFFTDTETTEIYTLSLHDALPIYPLPVLRRAARVHRRPHRRGRRPAAGRVLSTRRRRRGDTARRRDRKSTRLNSSHSQISYAVFCLKKKKRQRGQLLWRRRHLERR